MKSPVPPRHRPSRKSFVASRVESGRKSNLLAFLVIALFAAVTGEAFLVQVSRFLDQEVLDTCNEGILLSDEDADGTLDSTEFTTLVDILTDGAVSVDTISELPLRLRAIYFGTACLCAIEPGAASDCCVGDNSNIPIEDLDVEDPTTANRVFCSEMAKGIEDVKEDLVPTVAPFPSSAPSVDPSVLVPTVSPSPVVPVDTLCVSFQYEIMNDHSLSADDIMNENGNTLKSGLIEATRTTVINILNETYPRADGAAFENPNQVAKRIQKAKSGVNVGSLTLPSGQRRKLLQAVEQADAFVLDMDLHVYQLELRGDLEKMLNGTKSCATSRRLQYLREQQQTSSLSRYHSRRLVYYSDEFPVEITQIVDSITCPGSIMNDEIRCAVVSSTVCVVLEPGDDPAEIRQVIIDGLQEAFQNGDFVDNIPTSSTGRR